MPEFEFRKKALARLSSPERLDELIRVVEPRTWLALAGLVALVVAALAWSFADELPQRSSSAGALVAPNSIIGVFVPESGLVTAVLITEGDEVDENQPIARLRSPRGTLTLRAPAAGRLLDLALREGAPVQANTEVAQVVARELADLVTFTFVAPNVAASLRPRQEARISPVGVPEERYGFLRGRIASVRDLPESPAGILAAVQDEGLAQALARQTSGPPIEVRIALERAETPSGYAWTRDSGPPFALRDGTLTDVSITTGQRRPIDYLLPGGR